jgi:hypothetical protein
LLPGFALRCPVVPRIEGSKIDAAGLRARARPSCVRKFFPLGGNPPHSRQFFNQSIHESAKFNNVVSFRWAIAELLNGAFQSSEFQKKQPYQPFFKN